MSGVYRFDDQFGTIMIESTDRHGRESAECVLVSVADRSTGNQVVLPIDEVERLRDALDTWLGDSVTLLTVAPYRDKAESEMVSSWEQRFDCANCVKTHTVSLTIKIGDAFCARCGAKVDWSNI